ncbi:MAG TPA: hypothetical protein VGC10_06530 [Sphingomonas sp.]
MLKPLIRTLDGWRFELPLALVLGAAVAFAAIAMPASLFGWGRPLQGLFGALAALAAGFAAYRAMKYRWGFPSARTAAQPDEEEESDLAPIDIAVRLRRSDAHPDCPPREPIRASRDLGEPFMDIVGFADGPNASGRSRSPVIPDGEYVELPAPAAASPAVPEIAEQDVPAIAPVAAVAPEAHDSIAAFTPEPAIEPAPRPERARRESLAEMMERLSAGLERRAGRPVAPPPADMLAEVLARPRAATPELRDALDELNRLAGRRG